MLSSSKLISRQQSVSKIKAASAAKLRWLSLASTRNACTECNLVRFPLGWLHPSEKKSSRVNELGHAVIGKVGQLGCNMLYRLLGVQF
jgi:hypothetical protein